MLVEVPRNCVHMWLSSTIAQFTLEAWTLEEAADPQLRSSPVAKGARQFLQIGEQITTTVGKWSPLSCTFNGGEIPINAVPHGRVYIRVLAGQAAGREVLVGFSINN